MNDARVLPVSELSQWQKRSLIVGGVAAVALVAGGLLGEIDHLFQSYLIGWIFVLLIAIGSLALLMLQYLTGGVWGIIMRRPLEAAAATLPFVALGFLPIGLGAHSIYVWTHQEVVEHDALLQHKAAYLNMPFFWVRAVIFLGIWALMAYLLRRWSERFAESGDPWIALRIRSVSAGGLLLLGLTLTFGAVDWVMSLEPHWFSTMYGLTFVVGSLLSAHVFVTLVVVLLARREPYAGVLQSENLRDLGNLMLAFTMLWAYIAFSQYLLIWYGNLREEVTWYLARGYGGWGVIAVGLMLFHFFLPFFALLMRDVKDRAKFLGGVAALLLLMRAVDVFWTIAPAFAMPHGAEAAVSASHHVPFRLHWTDPVAILAVGGLWLGIFFWKLRARPVLPMHEEHVKEVLSHG